MDDFVEDEDAKDRFELLEADEEEDDEESIEDDWRLKLDDFEDDDSSSSESYRLTVFFGLGISSQLTQPVGVVGLSESFLEFSVFDWISTISDVCCRVFIISCRAWRGFCRPCDVNTSQVVCCFV